MLADHTKKLCYVNDNYVDYDHAKIHINDRGYVFADGVYEVVLFTQGVLLDWEAHCKRLQQSLGGLRITYDVDIKTLHEIAITLMHKNHLSEGILYLQITRGVPKTRHHKFPVPAVQPSFVMTASAVTFPDSSDYLNGCSAITHPDLRWKLRHLKTISLLPNILAQQAAAEQNCIEAILVEDNHIITEGSSTNVFIVDNKKTLRTHPADTHILSGITRNNVLHTAKLSGLKIEEKPFTKDELLKAYEVFITSTTKHILPITTIDHIAVHTGNVGPVTQQLIQAYQGYLQKQF